MTTPASADTHECHPHQPGLAWPPAYLPACKMCLCHIAMHATAKQLQTSERRTPILPTCAVAAGQAQVLSLLNPHPGTPPACLSQLYFSLKHGALTLESIQPPAIAC